MTIGDGEYRQEMIVEAAAGVFLRFGFKKVSMQEIARSAGLSRQGLYLHFSTKEILFTAVVERFVEVWLAAARTALSAKAQPIEGRLLDAFVALREAGEDRGGKGQHAELLATAAELAPAVVGRLDREIIEQLAHALEASGVADRWKRAGLSARDLAENLHATSSGLKHARLGADEYRARMRTAVQITCRRGSRPSEENEGDTH